MLDYYGIDTIPLHDDRASPILQSIVNKLSESWILAIHCKPSSCLWIGYNMAKRFQSQSLLFSNVLILSDSWRLAMDHKPSHCLWAEYHTTKRFQSQSLLLSVVYQITDSQGLTMHHKPSSHLWAGYNMVDQLWFGTIWPRDSNPRA